MYDFLARGAAIGGSAGFRGDGLGRWSCDERVGRR